MNIRVGVLGATGYAGQQLIALLAAHPRAEIVFAASHSYAGERFDAIYPAFLRVFEQELLAPEAAMARLGEIDLLFAALPNALVFPIARACRETGVKLIDFSADFRLTDPKVYEQWYKTEHTAADLLTEAVYGLPELYREDIRTSWLIANPGCYTTASILALAPFVAQEGLLEPDSLVIDAKSGITGAGRKADVSLSYTEAADSIKAYGIAGHRHTPEIEQVLTDVADRSIRVQFTPHLMPMKRGILATIYGTLTRPLQTDDLYAILDTAYADEPFLRVRRGTVETRFTEHTNFVDLAVQVDPRTNRFILTSSLDNLMKGAASQAVQNMNVLFDLPETEGLQGWILAP